MSTTETRTDREPEPEINDEQTTESSTLPLPKRFLATASGPVTKVTMPSSGATERATIELSVQHSIETLEEFATFWVLHSRNHWKAGAIEAVLDHHEPDDVAYGIDREQLDEWEVEVDGRVEAFVGLVETMADYDGRDPRKRADLPRQISDRLRLLSNDSCNVDECVEMFAEELQETELWGPGARLAYLNVRNAHHEEIDLGDSC